MYSKFIFVVAVIQSLQTGSFLTLDLAAHSLQQYWDFSTNTMIEIGTVGCALGFSATAIFALLILPKLSTAFLAVISGIITGCCWLLLRIFICQNCMYWYFATILEAGIAMGTAIGYGAAIQLLQKHITLADERKWKVTTCSLSVSIGSILAVLLFLFINNLPLVLLIMLFFSLVSSILLFLVTLIPVTKLDDNDFVFDNSVKFSWNFVLYLLALNISFGTIVTAINSASNMLKLAHLSWPAEAPIVLAAIANLIGRSIGLLIKKYLNYILLLFSSISLTLAILHFLLFYHFTIQLVLANLIILALFFGLLWSTSMSLAREFYNISETRALGMIFTGMTIGPLIFGPFASWTYLYRVSHNNCDTNCYAAYFLLAAIASVVATIGYVVSWWLKR